MMKQMQDMMKTMLKNSNQNNNQNNNNQNNNNNNRDRGGRNSQGRGRGGRGGRGNPPSARLYCWSHGSCAHCSNDCERRAPGHQTMATFANMMEGSKNGCYWLT
jgi:hypothetical protein